MESPLIHMWPPPWKPFAFNASSADVLSASALFSDTAITVLLSATWLPKENESWFIFIFVSKSIIKQSLCLDQTVCCIIKQKQCLSSLGKKETELLWFCFKVVDCQWHNRISFRYILFVACTAVSINFCDTQNELS